MILLWGLPGDTPTRRVCDELGARGISACLLDQTSTPEFSLSFSERDPDDGMLNVFGKEHPLQTIVAAYPRPYDSERVCRAQGWDSSSDAACRVRAFDQQMLLWLEMTPALVANRPSTSACNNSKPLQAKLIEAEGFAVPATLITSDSEAAAAFQRRFGQVVYKSMSGVRSRVAELSDVTLQRLQRAACPLQLQERVNGEDLRVHVIGDEVFACRITSDAVDYRYSAGATFQPEMSRCDLPPHIAESCLRLTRNLGWSIAGIDLRHADDGRWVCFEANPSPGYTVYEDATGAPITVALVRLLLRGSALANRFR